MTNNKQRDRLVELLQKASEEAGKYFRETTKKVLAEKGRFSSKEDIDRKNIYEVEADYLLEKGVIVPPCKVGDKVYFVFEGDVLSDEITLIEVTKSAMYLSTCSERYMLIDGYLYSEMLDEKAYFTKEEAENALKGSADNDL